ncbi:MAG: DUF655 domain-containing protein, partial [Candidatus Helarchaeales archaeon]
MERDHGRKKYEEYVVVLDFLQRGRQDLNSRKPSYSSEPLVQAIGEEFFTLLELVPYKHAYINIRERIYIGKQENKRKKIAHIKKRIRYEDLTSTAKFEINGAIESIIDRNPKRFLDFFNNARPITTRKHQLELLPGVGKKLMWDFINEVKKKPFDSFEEITERVRIPDPKKLIVKRILQEIENEHEKYRLFTRYPPH